MSSSQIQPNKFRLTVVFYPAPGITYEQFSDYWLNNHGKLFLSLDIVRKNLTKYEQHHFNVGLNGQLAQVMGTTSTEFWGMSTFEAESVEKIQELFAHPDYARVIFPDEKNFLDRSKSIALAGGVATLWSQPEA